MPACGVGQTVFHRRARNKEQQKVCILLCQCSAPAAVWESTQAGQLYVTPVIPGPSLHPTAPPGMPCSKDDPETDLSHAQSDEANQEQRGCCCRGCCCQEAGVCSSGPSVARQQVREEMHPELSQTQTQYKTCSLTYNPLPTINYPPSYSCHSGTSLHGMLLPSQGKVHSDYCKLDRYKCH